MTAGGLRVVYIAGAQHCGSTLLDAILGHAPGAASLGEVGGFHRFAAGPDCDCGQAPAGCDPCRAVVGELAGTPGGLGAFTTVSAQPLKERRAWWALGGAGGRRRYGDVSATLLAAAARALDAVVVVDSSKNVGRAAALAAHPDLDVRVIHLVRDGRAYLGSKRRRARAEGRRHLAPLAHGAWLAKNLLVSSVLAPRLGSEGYLLVRYEDLVGDLAGELARIGAFTGLDVAGLDSAVGRPPGLSRGHLYEPRRRMDYSQVVVDPARGQGRRCSGAGNLAFWLGGGFLSRRWGYNRAQITGPR